MAVGSILIRQAIPDDVPLLVPLVRAYWAFEQINGFDAPRVAEQLARLLGEHRLGGGWIAFVDDQPAGYLLAVYVFSLEHLGITAEIDEFFVLEAHRGRRIGRGLLQAAEAAFVRAGCTNVSLQLARTNAAARAFYRRHGYSQRAAYELLEKTIGNA